MLMLTEMAIKTVQENNNVTKHRKSTHEAKTAQQTYATVCKVKKSATKLTIKSSHEAKAADLCYV